VSVVKKIELLVQEVKSLRSENEKLKERAKIKDEKLAAIAKGVDSALNGAVKKEKR
jgi:hypothetical protein